MRRKIILASILTIVVAPKGLAQSSKQEPTIGELQGNWTRCAHRWPKCRIELLIWRRPKGTQRRPPILIRSCLIARLLRDSSFGHNPTRRTAPKNRRHSTTKDLL